MMLIENLTVNLNPGASAQSRSFIEELLRNAAEQTRGQHSNGGATEFPSIVMPKIGEYWLGQGGIYAGMARGRDGESDYPLILATYAPDHDFKWQGGLDHAKTVEADGHKDFTVPTRWESALLYANLQDLFDTNFWYWTSSQYSENYAWIQYFGYGSQYDHGGKDFPRRCRFVRRSSVL